MKIREVASGLQFPEGPIALEDGSVLLVEIARGTLSRVTPANKLLTQVLGAALDVPAPLRRWLIERFVTGGQRMANSCHQCESC